MIRIPRINQINKTAYVFLMLCVLSVSQFLGIMPLNLIISAAIITIACFADVDELFVILYATLPFYNLISLRTGTYSLHYLIVGIFILKFLLCNKISILKLFAFLFLFVLRIFAEDFVLLVSWSLLILPLILTADDDIWLRNIKRILFWLNLSIILSCITGYIMMAMQKSIYTTAYLYISGVRTVRFAGLTGDSIAFGQTCVLAIGLNLVYCYFNPNAHKKFYILSSILLTIAALLSYSKMTLISILAVITVFLVLYGKAYATNREHVIKAVVFGCTLTTAIAIIIFALVNYSGNSAVILGYIDRFNRDDLTTGRFSLWGVYLEMLGSTPQNLFLPLTNEALSTPIWNPSTNSYVSYVHNLYLETIAAFGWCGAFLIFIWIATKLYRFFATRCKLILSIPILILLAMGLGSHGNFEYQFYLQLALAFSFLNPHMEEVLPASDET